MQDKAPLLAAVALFACTPDTTAAEASSNATGSESESQASSETSSGSDSAPSTTFTTLDTGTETDTDTQTDTDTDTQTDTDTDTGEEPIPELVGDNCEVELLWSYLAVGGLDADKLQVLEVTGPNAFVIAGLEESAEDEHRMLLIGLVDGEPIYTLTEEPAVSNPYTHFVREISVTEDGSSFLALVNAGSFSRGIHYSAEGEKLSVDSHPNAVWEDIVRLPGEMRVVGRTLEGDDSETTLARLDESGNLLDTVFAPTVGITQADHDWATELVVDGDRQWVAGWDDDRCAVLIEFDALGSEQWWECVASAEDGEGRVNDMERLPNGNLLLSGSARVTKNGYWYREPWLTAVTPEGLPVWDWRPGFNSTFAGGLEDFTLTAEGDVIAVYGESNLSEGGVQGTHDPVLWRRDQDGAFVARCELERPGLGLFDWDASLLQVALDADENIYVLLEEHYDSIGDRNFALLRIDGLE